MDVSIISIPISRHIIHPPLVHLQRPPQPLTHTLQPPTPRHRPPRHLPRVELNLSDVRNVHQIGQYNLPLVSWGMSGRRPQLLGGQLGVET